MSAQNPNMPESVAMRLDGVRKRMSDAAHRRGDDVTPTLIAVSKTFGVGEITPLIEAGQRLFGENRVQEAAEKWPALKAQVPEIELHLIGPLQTNKLKQALTLFDVFHTLDRERLADALVKERIGGARLPRLFIQVNIGAEPQKAGILPDEADRFIARCCDDLKLPVEGLMCIPPAQGDPEPHFKNLAEIAARHRLKHLSMGMSGDFEMAIECGATHVRVGSALFGTR